MWLPFKVRTTLDVSRTLERSLKSYDKEGEAVLIHLCGEADCGERNTKKGIDAQGFDTKCH